jgi:hypothetical protein
MFVSLMLTTQSDTGAPNQFVSEVGTSSEGTTFQREKWKAHTPEKLTLATLPKSFGATVGCCSQTLTGK